MIGGMKGKREAGLGERGRESDRRDGEEKEKGKERKRRESKTV